MPSETSGGRSKSKAYKSSGKGKETRRADYDQSDTEVERTPRQSRDPLNEEDPACES